MKCRQVSDIIYVKGIAKGQEMQRPSQIAGAYLLVIRFLGKAFQSIREYRQGIRMNKGKEYIKVQNLQKNYIQNSKGQLSVLNDISFKVAKGEVVCIIGSSGCGKSTLLRCVAGLDADYEGEILIEEKLIKTPDKKRGFVYQEARLFPWLTVEDNIKFVINDGTKEEKYQRVKSIISLVDLDGAQKMYPKELSGGMAQRVNIARALVNEPEILFLDEPFGALDALTRMQLQNELLKVRRELKNTMLLVTHDIDEAVYLADKIIVLGNRPAKILDIISVDLGKERDRTSVEFLEVKKKVYKYFEEK